MRRWKSILATLCLAAVTPAFAHAAVQFKGLQFSPAGACVADLDGDGRLDLHNIGSSGQDGVSIDCTHMDGAMLVLDGSVSHDIDLGASCTQTYRWSLIGQLGGSTAVARSAFVVSPSSLDFSFSCSPELSSATTQTVTLYRDGAAVYSAVVDASTPVSVAFDPATGGCPLPAMATGLKRTTEVIEWRESGDARMHASVGGHDEDCDDFTVSRSLHPGAVEVCDGASEDMRFAAPPGSSLGQVLCSDGACRALDHWVQGAGAASVSVDVDASGLRRLKTSGIGSSGNDGVTVLSRAWGAGGGGGGGSGGSSIAFGDVDGDGYAADCVMSPPSLVFDPAVDDGASAALTVVGSFFSSSTGTSSPASVAMSMNIGSQSSGAGAGKVSMLQVACDHGSLGSTSEWATVLSHGVVVSSVQVPTGSPVSVLAPPDGPPAFAVASMGASRGNCCRGHVIIMKTPMDGARGPAQAASASSIGDGTCPMEVSFRCSRLFVVGGRPPVSGDQLVISGDETGAYSGSFQATSSVLRMRKSSGSQNSLSMLDFGSSLSDAVQPDVPGASLTTASTSVSVPFSFLRADATPARAFSVTFHLSAELQPASSSFVTEGDYLSSVSSTQFYVTDNGGGSYTVDDAIFGPVCGATGSGQLFSLQLAAAAGVTSGMGSVVVDNVVVRDCSNQPVPASAGSPGYVPVQLTSPPALTSLTAVQVKSGNPQPSSTTGVQLAWPVSSLQPGSSVQVFRKGYDYYQAQAPSPPSSPSDALSRSWSNAACLSGHCSAVSCSTGTCVASGLLDSPPSRDYLYYVVFVVDAFGNASACSNMTTGTLDYHLGDVSDGSTACSGDDHVDIADVSLLGSHYGVTVSSGSPFACLDVGPTTDYSVDGRPLRDGKVSFEDLMMFAINFSVVSAPQFAARPLALANDAAVLGVPERLPAVGETFEVPVVVDGAGDAQGLSVKLAYDASVVEQVSVASGALLDAQGRGGLVVSSGPGNVDAALLGAGPGLAGHGELARVTFRVLAAGDAKLAIAGVSARDAANRPVPVAGVAAGAAGVSRSGLGIVFPNPFRDAVEIRMSLRRDGAAKLAVYDVAGRRVRTLLAGVQPAGTRTVAWDGADDAGLRLAPGAYVVRLEAGDRVETRTVRLVR